MLKPILSERFKELFRKVMSSTKTDFVFSIDPFDSSKKQYVLYVIFPNKVKNKIYFKDDGVFYGLKELCLTKDDIQDFMRKNHTNIIDDLVFEKYGGADLFNGYEIPTVWQRRGIVFYIPHDAIELELEILS